MITLRQLISVAPLSEEVKKELLAAAPTFSAGKVFEVEQLCWAMISQWYQNELSHRQETAVLEIAQGKTYAEDYFEKLPDMLYRELVEKLQEEETEENLEAVRAKLAAVVKKDTP
jgi:hypothetical protein